MLTLLADKLESSFPFILALTLSNSNLNDCTVQCTIICYLTLLTPAPIFIVSNHSFNDSSLLMLIILAFQTFSLSACRWQTVKLSGLHIHVSQFL